MKKQKLNIINTIKININEILKQLGYKQPVYTATQLISKKISKHFPVNYDDCDVKHKFETFLEP